MTQPDWDDERLDAAFRARFDRPAPTDLAHDVHVRIAGTSPRRLVVGRLRPAWSAAIAAVVIVALTGTALVGLGGLGTPGSSPGPQDATSSGPAPSPVSTERAIAGEVFGLTIIHVPEAITVRDSGADDREIAVAGFFTPGTTTVRCAAPVPPHTSPLQPDCGDGSLWLTRDPESLVHQTGDLVTGTDPQGPAIRPWLQGLGAPWEPADRALDANGDSIPVDVVLIGHFDDRRDALCPEAERAACQDRFVVDAVASVGGIPLARSESGTASATSTVADIEAVIAKEAPNAPILSMAALDLEGIAFLEPSLGPIGQGVVDHPLVWVVRVLESERAVTYFVIDGTDAIYEINPDGDAILVGGTPPTPEATASSAAWPPAGARVIDLTSEVGAGAPPARVAVIDHSGRLTGVNETGAVDPSTKTLARRIEAYAEPDISPGRVHLAWVGGICDSQITVTVAEDLRTISFDMGPLVDCDSIGIGRQLVLDFEGEVNVSEIELVDATGTPPSEIDPVGYALHCGVIEHDACLAKAAEIVAATPERRVESITFTDECGSYTAEFKDAGDAIGAIVECVAVPEPAYTLDCGPLSRDTCETKAAAIVAANLKGSPPRRVVSVVFEGLCGSFTATYDDGTGSGADIDCILFTPKPS